MFLEERVLGEKRKGVTCEEIGEEKILQNISVSDKILKAKPLTSLQVVYFWNEKQLKFLLEDKRLVLFLADFGVGKTLMKKHKALSVASQNQDVEVIYLSLAQAVRHEETHQREKFAAYKNESIFDIANTLEFKNTGVNFVSLQDLLEETDWENGRINVCNVVERFIRCHDDAHLFIDEFPLTYERSDADVSFLNCIKERSKAKRYLWLTLRLCDVKNVFFEELSENKKHYETFLRNCGFEVPILTHNMRNSSFIVDTFETIYGYGQRNQDYKEEKKTRYERGMGPKDAKMMVDKATLPSNTVQGMRTVVVPVQGNSRADYKDPFDALSHVLNRYFINPNEPVVVLISESKYFATQNDKFIERINKAASESKRPFLVYPFKSPMKVSSIEIEKFIQSPTGVLLTDAEAFNGMQARNVVVISDGKRLDRNYIMRANAFVVFIQKRQEVDINITTKQNIYLDKTFLPENTQKSKDIGKHSNAVWLWHIPFGVQEKDVENHLESKKLDISSFKIEKLFYPPIPSSINEAKAKQNKKRASQFEKAKNQERQFVGFIVELLATSPIQFETIGFTKAENNFWPPGWSSKVYQGRQDVSNDDKRRSFTYSTEPCWIKVSVSRYSALKESDIQKFINSKVKIIKYLTHNQYRDKP